MKIDSNDQIMKSLYPEETVKHRKAGDKEFGNILKETLAEKPRPDAAPRQSAFVNPLASVRLTPEDLPDPKLAIDRIENMIDLLDRYRHQLADPRQNLKQMDTTIVIPPRQDLKRGGVGLGQHVGFLIAREAVDS